MKNTINRRIRKLFDCLIIAALIFVGVSLLNEFLDKLDPCFDSHTDICMEAKTGISY